MSSRNLKILTAVSIAATFVLVVAGSLEFNGSLVHAQSATPFRLGGIQGQDSTDGGGSLLGPSAEQFDNRAYPSDTIGYAQTLAAQSAAQAIINRGSDSQSSWQEVTNLTNFVPGTPGTSNFPNATTVSGRISSLAISPHCGNDACRVWVGAAGGGIWISDNAMSTHPDWRSSSAGLDTLSIGSIALDPTAPSGNTLYVGTGEINGASDTEAGMGLYKSTDGGDHWSLVSGSAAVAANRGIGAVVVDPTNPKHIYMGTDVDRHGLSAVAGGRFTPPGAPQIGLYETFDGGATWTLTFSKPSDTVVGDSSNGGDFFRGGVTDIQLDPRDPSTVYLSMFDYGVFRKSARLDGDSSFHQIFLSGGGGTVAFSSVARTQFALAPLKNGDMRIYVGDVDTNGIGELYRTDHAEHGAASLFDGTNNGGWIALSNPHPGAPGFGSYNFCGSNIGSQCWYDMPVVSPPGQPDTVWIGGQFQYGEVGGPSNGRAIQRSTDAGVHFTDMTEDPQGNGMHPDQHAIVFNPQNANIAFIGSDGGLVRTSGNFTNNSASCSGRGLSGADLADCQRWLSVVPTAIYSLNDGLHTLQFQSVTLNPKNPMNDIMGGTQDNGTWAFNGQATGNSRWFETIGGDGGVAIIDAINPNIRMHTFTGSTVDVNYHGTNTLTWYYTGDPIVNSGEASSFYSPLIGDPTVSRTMFFGATHVWRTQDSGGPEATLVANKCSEELPGSQFDPLSNCGDWVALGGPNLVGSAFGSDKSGSFVVAMARAAGDTSGNVLWTGTRRGRLFISVNAAANPASSVTFTRIDIPLGQPGATPNRFISGIVVDPANADHAWVAFSGYNAYTPATQGHLFDVVYNPTTKSATWTDISNDLGDVPITGIARNDGNGDLYAATDFGVFVLRHNSSHWTLAASGMPNVTIYDLAIDSQAGVLYAATHGRGIWRLTFG